MVPDYCEVTVDLRLPLGGNRRRSGETIQEMLAESGVSVEYELGCTMLANSRN